MKIFLILILFLIAQTIYASPVNVLIVGKAGVGKSSLINFLLNRDATFVNDGITGTKYVKSYPIYKFGQKINIYDTPGLFDMDNNDNIIRKIHNKLQYINLLLICYDLSEPRISKDDKNLICWIIQNLGKDILSHSIIIFTKGNLFSTPREAETIAYKRNFILNNYNIPYKTSYNNDFYIWKIKLFNMFKENINFKGLQKNHNGKFENKKIKSNIDTGCFGFNQIVKTKTGDKLIQYVKKGDFIFTEKGFSEVFFTYIHNNEYQELIVLETSSRILKITSNHIIPVIRNNKLIYILAIDVIVGDYLKLFPNTEYMIVKISKEIVNNTIYIQTFNDNILVNDIVVSTHVDNKNLSKFLMHLMKIIYNYCPNCLNQDTIFIKLCKYVYDILKKMIF